MDLSLTFIEMSFKSVQWRSNICLKKKLLAKYLSFAFMIGVGGIQVKLEQRSGTRDCLTESLSAFAPSQKDWIFYHTEN